jgi:hypothetical protein
VTTLEPLPPSFAETRDALHRVAEEIVAPARKPHNEIALSVVPGGFGTPPFEHNGRRLQVRVEGDELVVEADGVQTRGGLESLADAGALVGAELLPDGLPEDSRPLAIDPAAAGALAAFYAFAAEALDGFKGSLPDDAEPSATILWPEHFDVAIEAGAEAAGQRANYGGSPGDEHHPEPYLYVGPWTARPEGELWNATGFPGAELPYAELASAPDPGRLAREFFEARARDLANR